MSDETKDQTINPRSLTLDIVEIGSATQRRISSRGRQILTMSHDGTVEFSTALQPTEAAKEAWAILTAIAEQHNVDVRSAIADRDRLAAEVERLREALTAAAADVLAERARQISAEGWAQDHDDTNNNAEMAQAAACYALNAAGWKTEALRGCWPIEWWSAWFKPTTPRRDLVKAGALILAEIERLDRAAHAARREGE